MPSDRNKTPETPLSLKSRGQGQGQSQGPTPRRRPPPPPPPGGWDLDQNGLQAAVTRMSGPAMSSGIFSSGISSIGTSTASAVSVVSDEAPCSVSDHVSPSPVSASFTLPSTAADQDIVGKDTDDDAQLLEIQSALKDDPSTREQVLRMIHSRSQSQSQSKAKFGSQQWHSPSQSPCPFPLDRHAAVSTPVPTSPRPHSHRKGHKRQQEPSSSLPSSQRPPHKSDKSKSKAKANAKAREQSPSPPSQPLQLRYWSEEEVAFDDRDKIMDNVVYFTTMLAEFNRTHGHQGWEDDELARQQTDEYETWLTESLTYYQRLHFKSMLVVKED